MSEGFQRIWASAKSTAGREGFLHWEVAFPGVWRNWQDSRPSGGFDAVIGNPPWDRIKLQEVEWFAIREGGTGHHCRRTKGSHKPASQSISHKDEFDAAKKQAEELGSMLSGHYPLLFSGAQPLLPVCRARYEPREASGFVGLLTPSGIYADRSAANFFAAC